MDPYSSISSTLSLIIGLGIAKLLSIYVNVFKHRKRIRINIIPITWSICIFLTMLQMFWAIIELGGTKQSWTIEEFLLFLTMALVIFAAGSLVLPDSNQINYESLSETFQQDGKWSLVLISAYFALAIYINLYLFHTPINSLSMYLNVINAILPLIYIFVRSTRLDAIVTIVFTIVLLYSLWINSPKSYNEDKLMFGLELQD